MEKGQQQTLLVVDDDDQVRTLLRRYLEIEGFRVLEAADGTAMRQVMAGEPVGLVLLDIGLPGEDGLTLARDLRGRSKVGIIMLTGKHDPVDRIVGLEVGADDYVTKPPHLRELLARIKSVLRRTENNSTPGEALPVANTNERYSFDGWSIDASAREVKNPDGQRVALTTLEFDLLLVLLQQSNRVLSRDALMDALKGVEWTPLDRGIDSLVARLRKKIEPDTDEPVHIKTVRGAGYLFASKVQRG